MGINGLKTLGKGKAPAAFFNMPITTLQRRKVAIDAANWMYSTLSSAIGVEIKTTDLRRHRICRQRVLDQWYILAFKNVNNWLTHDITPILCFDGEAPIEKDDTKAYRRDKRQILKDKIDACYAIIDADPNCDDSVIKTLSSALKGYLSMTTEEYTMFRETFESLGIPCIDAKGDGERLCSMLCREGKVAAVYSRDTDTMAYGCPLIINDIHYGHKTTIECIRTDLLLSGMNMTFPQFVDFCIMSGCDYNENMPGIASVRSFNLITQHGCIENLPSTLDITCLNYERCRELLSVKSSNELMQKPVEFKVRHRGIPQNLLNGCSDGFRTQLTKLSTLANRIADPFHGLIPSLKLGIVGQVVKPPVRIRLEIVPDDTVIDSVSNLSISAT